MKEKIEALFTPIFMLVLISLFLFAIYDGWNTTNQAEKEIRTVLSGMGYETKSVSVSVTNMEAFAQTDKGKIFIENIKDVEDSLYVKKYLTK